MENEVINLKDFLSANKSSMLVGKNILANGTMFKVENKMYETDFFTEWRLVGIRKGIGKLKVIESSNLASVEYFSWNTSVYLGYIDGVSVCS